MKKFFAWIGRNEKHLSTVAFVVSFIIDTIAYERVDLPWVSVIFSIMFLVASVCIIVNHYLHRDRADAAPSIKNPFYTILPIIAQFFTGGLLSGCFIFYTRSANLLSSWPFILLLAMVFFGNELFSKYRERLTFQTVQLFLALYLYAIFELPIERGEMGSIVFVESGSMTVVAFALFLGILWFVGKRRLELSLRRIVLWCGVFLVAINFFYFTGVLPPLPLSLKDAEVYHSVTKSSSGYTVTAESGNKPFFGVAVEHVVPGSALYVYSAVFAPIKITTPIVHRWEKFEDGTWTTVSKVAFPIAGGRDTGYRGYSWFDAISAGQWRVSIETENGAVLGRVRFDVEAVQTPVQVYVETK